MGRREFHYGGYGTDRGRCGRGAEYGQHEVCKGSASIRRAEGTGGTWAKAAATRIGCGVSGAGRPEGPERAGANTDVPGWGLWEREVVSGRREGKVPGRYRRREADGGEPRHKGIEARVGGMACDWRADAAAVCADGGTGQCGCTR